MIRGEKVDLVAISMDYLPLYKKWISDPEATDMLGDTKFPISMEQERQWVEEQLSQREFARTFTVLTRKGEPIGNVGFNEINYQTRRAIIGILIGEKNFWDKGYGTDAMRTLMRFGFEELGMVKLELGVHSLNKRAIACYKKCGFVVEGVQRRHDFYKGHYCDGLRMGILRDEWETIYRKEERTRARP